MQSSYFVFLVAALGVFAFIAPAPSAQAQYYQHQPLESRVAELERLVEQMQRHIDQLADRVSGGGHTGNGWTCRLQAWGKPYSATAPTRAQAKAQVLSKCGARTHSMHCRESEVTCDR